MRIERSGRGLRGHLDWQNPRGGSIGERTPSTPSPNRRLPGGSRGSSDSRWLSRFSSWPRRRSRPGRSPLRRPAVPANKDVPEAFPPPPPPTVVPTPVRVADASSGDKGSRPRGPSVLVGMGIAGAVGISSDPVPLARLFLTLEWSHVAVEVGGEASLPSTTQVSDGASFSQGGSPGEPGRLRRPLHVESLRHHEGRRDSRNGSGC